MSHDTALYRYRLWRTLHPDDAGNEAAQAVRNPEQTARRESTLIERALHHPDAASQVVEPASVDQAIADLVTAHGGEAELARALAAAGLQRDELERAVAAELHAGILLDRVADTAEVTEAEVRAYHEAHADRMIRPEIRTASQILITLNDDFPENTRAAASERMAHLAERLHSEPRLFPELALAHSECPSAMQNGVMGQVRRGQLFPELDEALFALEAGGLSSVLESPLGLHLLRCDAIEPSRAVPYEEAAPRIRAHLEERARKQRVREWLERAESGHPPG